MTRGICWAGRVRGIVPRPAGQRTVVAGSGGRPGRGAVRGGYGFRRAAGRRPQPASNTHGAQANPAPSYRPCRVDGDGQLRATFLTDVDMPARVASASPDLLEVRGQETHGAVRLQLL